jgi:hypothetical protein
MRSIRASVLAGIGLGLIAAGAAGADNTCTQQARGTFRSCAAQCRDDLRTARFACRGVDPVCGKACLAGRQVCTDPIEEVLETGQLPQSGTLEGCATGTRGCKADLEAARTACGPPCHGDATCDACVDGAQVTAFVCRDGCRESWRRNATVRAMREGCRTTFRACVAACPKL